MAADRRRRRNIKNSPAGSVPAGECLEKWNEFMALDKIEIEKRTKKKTVNLVDIKPHITQLGAEAEGECVKLQLRLLLLSHFRNDFS